MRAWYKMLLTLGVVCSFSGLFRRLRTKWTTSTASCCSTRTRCWEKQVCTRRPSSICPTTRSRSAINWQWRRREVCDCRASVNLWKCKHLYQSNTKQAKLYLKSTFHSQWRTGVNGVIKPAATRGSSDASSNLGIMQVLQERNANKLQ